MLVDAIRAESYRLSKNRTALFWSLLFVPIIGGMVWKRGTLTGAVAGIVAGIVFTFGDMAYLALVEGIPGEDAIGADEPVYIGMLGSLIAYVVVSLMTAPTPAAVMEEWLRRVRKTA